MLGLPNDEIEILSSGSWKKLACHGENAKNKNKNLQWTILKLKGHHEPLKILFKQQKTIKGAYIVELIRMTSRYQSLTFVPNWVQKPKT
jgi:hypothetical protein